MRENTKTAVSMRVTVEQYERDLKEPLGHLGYKWDDSNTYDDSSIGLGTRFNIITNCYNGNLGSLCNISDTVTLYGFIEEYNPELFLALAAMTTGDDITVGEYMTVITDNLFLPKGNIFKVKQVSNAASSVIKGKVKQDLIGDYYRKATKEELINHFTKNNNKMEENKTDDRFPFKLQQKDANRILDVACGTWQAKLMGKWGRILIRDGEVAINEEFYKEMRKACDVNQNALFDDIFGKDEEDLSIDLSGFIETAWDGDNPILEVRKRFEYGNKAFWLNSNYNWEIKEDSNKSLVLIPTRKKK